MIRVAHKNDYFMQSTLCATCYGKKTKKISHGH